MDSLKARSPKSEEHLLGLVNSIHSILVQYEQDIRLVPYTPGLWSGNATESLIDRLRKISQYIKACEELLRAARRYRIFSNIAVEFVDLQQGGRRLSVDAESDANEIIAASCTRETLSRISSQRRKSVWDTRQSITARLGGTSRLHAEVQLVLYYEQDANLLRPRVICSSKSACYLCHLLVRIHGQYYIPSTHGKLYDTWKWPAPTRLPDKIGRRGAQIDLQRLLPEFSNAIDHKIRDCLNKARVVRRIDPLESRVDLLAAITPSILSRISRSSRSVRSVRSGARHRQEHLDVASAGFSDVDDAFSTTSIETCTELAPLSQTTPPPPPDTLIMRPIVRAEDSASCGGIATATMARHPSRGSSVSSLQEGSVLCMASQGGRGQELSELQREPLCLRKGESSNQSFDTDNVSLQIHVPGLHVALQYDASPAQGTRLGGQTPQAQRKSFQMEIQCLSSSAQCADNGLAQIVDLEDGNWVEKSAPEGILFSTDGLLLKRRSILLRLSARWA